MTSPEPNGLAIVTCPNDIFDLACKEIKELWYRIGPRSERDISIGTTEGGKIFAIRIYKGEEASSPEVMLTYDNITLSGVALITGENRIRTPLENTFTAQLVGIFKKQPANTTRPSHLTPSSAQLGA